MLALPFIRQCSRSGSWSSKHPDNFTKWKCYLPAGNVNYGSRWWFNSGEQIRKGKCCRWGHIHYFMDVALSDRGRQARTHGSRHILSNCNTSTHDQCKPECIRFAVELVNNDHTPLVPAKYTMINVTVNGRLLLLPLRGGKDSMGYWSIHSGRFKWSYGRAQFAIEKSVEPNG